MVDNLRLKDIASLDLVGELLDRCSPSIFIGSKNEGLDGNGRTTFYQFKGHPAVCYGLCHEMAFTIMQESLIEKD